MRIFVSSVAVLGFGWAATLGACHGPMAVVGRDSAGAAGEGALTEGSGGTSDGSGGTGGASPSGSGGVAEPGGTGGATTGGSGGTAAAAESGGTGAVVGAPRVSTTTSRYVSMLASPTGDPSLTLRCLPRAVFLEPAGSPQFRVYRFAQDACACDEPGYAPASEVERSEVLSFLEDVGACGGAGQACADLCVCTELAATGADEAACLSDLEDPGGAAGWCYVRPQQGLGTAEVLGDCASDYDSAIRLIGERDPDAGFVIFGTQVVETETTTPEHHRPVGVTCIPELERRTDFVGFSMGEAIVETGNPACDSSICLVNHFQGRVSCPFGQTYGSVEAAMPECFVPGSGAPVTVPVDSMRLERAARFTTTCSCRCDGPGEGPFCACPEGTECAPIMGESGSEALNALAGSYCIPSGHAFDSSKVITPETCSTERAAGHTNSFPLDYSVCEDPLPY